MIYLLYCRKDKIKKALRKSAVVSESGSEHSHSRDSTLLTATQLKSTIQLASPPEKGILKKWPRNTDILDCMEPIKDNLPVRVCSLLVGIAVLAFTCQGSTLQLRQCCLYTC